ncbi:bacterial regulatory helix-turn-helix, lysR family protein [Burkholderia thailandensis MSMB121]|uniref:LysR family transcriptional regulator n=2 Tax=Burkholderia humptydooensis TaxID=430531 RepID=A0A7U4SUM6_9BURK|nr:MULTISPECIES: LysR substrate-binding domain-containing protein [Burkholderia]AGK50389.1 bacterial regulatory helix-turn-helix, lysR family protein [Burkholderia thailandensis MSMB121]ATF32001.1 LysR family transcriptional regulator [Burkholderia thailandensis]AJY40447.1 bacterial regulatory helix-turn-helix, lysR family protein [Burkholderia sp. 2002721687]ALX44987.1 LysR family transcriptional regulator [Burkholderia humptydooensis]EIP85193.1 transcriptional regulator, LysR family protein 
MKHLYPNVAELHAFASSAKHLNFSYAARELGLTPSAVSRQIASLEALLGVRLFVREGRNLALTRAGRVYQARVAGPLREIGNASLELLSAREDSDLLTIASVPTFTTKWLVPRLPRFLETAPDLTLSFRRHLAPGDPFPLGLDAAIRYGDGRWEGVQCDYLDGRTFVPVCAPEFAERHALREPADIAAAPRLVHEQAECAWLAWADRHRVTQMNALAGPRFEQYSVLIQAAQAGLGIALIPAFLIRAPLAAGTLVQPLDAPVDVDEQGHYLCYAPERLQTSASLRLLREWMLGECAHA